MVENKQQCFIKPRKKERNKEVKKKQKELIIGKKFFGFVTRLYFTKKKKNATELKKMKKKYKF